MKERYSGHTRFNRDHQIHIAGGMAGAYAPGVDQFLSAPCLAGGVYSARVPLDEGYEGCSGGEGAGGQQNLGKQRLLEDILLSESCRAGDDWDDRSGDAGDDGWDAC